MRSACLVATATAALLLAWLAPQNALASWTAPVYVSSPGIHAEESQVVVAPNGNAVVVWRDRAVRARYRGPSGSFGGVETLSEPYGGNPDVAIDARGNAVFVWVRADQTTDCGWYGCQRAETRTRYADGTLSDVQVLSPPASHALRPQVGVDANGNAVFVWNKAFSDLTVQSRARAADGTLSEVETLTPTGPGLGYTYSPGLAVAPNGKGVFVWHRYIQSPECPDYCSRVQALDRSADGTLGEVQTLSPPGEHGSDQKVAIDGRGNAIVVWTLSNYFAGCRSNREEACTRVQARARSASGALSEVQTLADGAPFYEPEVAVAPNGNAVFSWTHATASKPRVETAGRSATGRLSGTRIVSDPSAGATGSSQLALDDDGDAVIVWVRRDYGIQARVRTGSGKLGPIATLSSPGVVGAFFPDVAVDPEGAAVAAWWRYDGDLECAQPYGCPRVEVSTGP